MKSLQSLHTNYAGAESEEFVAAGVLSFSPTGRGHEHAENCLNDLRNHFNGHDWGNNGPGVITRLVHFQVLITKLNSIIIIVLTVGDPAIPSTIIILH